MLVPDVELAQEIVKVHSFMPAKIGDSELKIIQVKQRVGLSTPVPLSSLTQIFGGVFIIFSHLFLFYHSSDNYFEFCVVPHCGISLTSSIENLYLDSLFIEH